MRNRGCAYTSIIGRACHGQTLLSHLAALYPHSTPEDWQQKLDNGEVTLDGATATGTESIASGQQLVWNRPPWVEPDTPHHFEVLLEDAQLLAVNKPGGLPTLPGAGFRVARIPGAIRNEPVEHTRILVLVFVRWSEEAIRRHWPALGTGILINSASGVRRRVYTAGVRETQNGNPGYFSPSS